jgi:hypothetical protein
MQHDLEAAIANTDVGELRKAHEAIKSAIAILKAANVQDPAQLNLAVHVLAYPLRPRSLTLVRIN